MSHKENNNWSFGDDFPTIEIDLDLWKSLTVKERLKYLGRLFTQDKELGNRLNILNYLIGTTTKIGKVFIKNKEIREYLDIVENSVSMMGVAVAVNKMFKSKQKYQTIKNNAMAKLMGFPNGNHIHETELELTSSMMEAFLDANESVRKKHNIIIDICDTGANNPASDKKEDDSAVKEYKIVGTCNEHKFGMKATVVSTVMDGGDDSTMSTRCKFYYPSSGMKMTPLALKDAVRKAIYDIYVSRVDTRKNFIKVNGAKLVICPRKEITEEITNVDINRIVTGMRRVLTENSRRGLMLVGEPGVGKTISVHKMINEFPDRLVFWVSSDSINTASGIRNVFKIFTMFPGSIIVFDDLDTAPFTAKDETTQEFLYQLDGKNGTFKGYIIATVNDPSKIHMSIINRPERLDDVVYVKLPGTFDEVNRILISKSRETGYLPVEDLEENEIFIGEDNKFLDEENSNGEDKVYIVPELDEYVNDATIDYKGNDVTFNGIYDFDTSEEYAEVIKGIIDNAFTHVQVAGLISDCHLFKDEYTIGIDTLKDSVKSRIDSIHTANMVATKGKLTFDANNISEEAKASLTKKSTQNY